MKVVYAKQPFPDEWTSAIFLVGPTPRDETTPSWRPEAIRLLKVASYDGVVLVPEVEDGEWKSGPDAYLEQVEWERRGLDLCDVALVWCPRDMATMPGLTTNVEVGLYATSDKCVLGAPDWAKSIKYLEHTLKVATGDGTRHTTLEATVQAAVDKINTLRGAAKVWDKDALVPGQEGEYTRAVRRGGERCVPLHIWTLKSFQDWYRNMVQAGNRLDDAKLLWHFRAPKARSVFSWVLWVKVWVEKEQRHKSNEYIFARTDISTVCLFKRPDQVFLDDPSLGIENLLNTQIILIREFRSPARTPDAMVHELPGGSSLPEKALRYLAAQDATSQPCSTDTLHGDLPFSEKAVVVRAEDDDIIQHVRASFGSVNDVAHVAGVLVPSAQGTTGSEVESSHMPESAGMGVVPVSGSRPKSLPALPHTHAGDGAGDGIRAHRLLVGERLPTDGAGARLESGFAVSGLDGLMEPTAHLSTKDHVLGSPCRTKDGVSTVATGVQAHDGFSSGARMGSSSRPVSDDYRQVAADEVHEETGLIIPAARFEALGSRQLAATLSSHHAHLFAAELTETEMAQAKALAAAETVAGVEEDSERTYVEVTTFGKMLADKLVDWSTVGMVAQALLRGE